MAGVYINITYPAVLREEFVFSYHSCPHRCDLPVLGLVGVGKTGTTTSAYATDVAIYDLLEAGGL